MGTRASVGLGAATAVLAAVAGLFMTVAARAAGPYSPPASVPRWGIGFRGDGTGVFAGSKPPVEWDEATGKNILWKAPLPNWGYSSPVPVGNRVLFMAEPGWKSIFPQLCCFDADTGELLWQRDVDPFDAFPDLDPAQRKAMTADLAWWQDLWRSAYRLTSRIAQAGGASADSPEMQKANQEMARLGFQVAGVRLNYGQLRALSFDEPTKARLKEIDRRLKPYGVVRYNTWDNNGRARVGYCFPTPVSDGRSVFVMTVHGTVACFDMDGRRLWSRDSGYRPGPSTSLMASPRLYGEMVLTPFIDHGSRNCLLAAWDKRTGEKRWSVPIPGGSLPGRQSRAGGGLVIMTLGQTDVALCSTGYVVRLPDGRVYAARIDQTLPTYAVDDQNDVIHSAGHADSATPRTAVELSLRGEELVVKDRYVLMKSYAPASAVFAGGRLFASQAQLDPVTGLLVGVPREQQADGIDFRKAPRTSPQTRHLLLATGTHVYGFYESRQKTGGRDGPAVLSGVGEVFTLDGRKVAANTLLWGPYEGEKLDQWSSQGFEHSFSYACAFNIGGDRIYVCSNDWLYCIGEKDR